MDRTGQTQANIAVGEVGINLLDPDSFALDVLGDIMNGFGGRLFDEIRSKEVCILLKFPCEQKQPGALSADMAAAGDAAFA